SALDDLAAVAELCNRLNRIPTTSTGRIREDLVAGWLDTAAACAPSLTLAGREEVARLAQLIEPSNERRVLLGEASKQLQAAR
ncbi:hypothetical protein ABTN02_20345, partial [Acinetobacter baumannii]